MSKSNFCKIVKRKDMLFNLKEDCVKINNTTMDYVVFGKGKNPLVIIPGLSMNRVKGAGVFLAYMYRIFAKDYRVYIFDRKETIAEEYTIKEIAADTAYAMKELAISQSCLFGVSQGGMIAQYLAMDYPELVKKLVLGVTLSKQNETVKNVVETWIQFVGSNDMQGFIEDMLFKMYSSEYIRKYRILIPVMIKKSKKADLNRFIILAKSCLNCDTYEALYKIQCPVLVLGGKQDKVVTGKASEEIAEKLQCEIYMYEELGHAAYEEAKDFNERIYQFFKKENNF